jgi:hypothetical protein
MKSIKLNNQIKLAILAAVLGSSAVMTVVKALSAPAGFEVCSCSVLKGCRKDVDGVCVCPDDLPGAGVRLQATMMRRGYWAQVS